MWTPLRFAALVSTLCLACEDSSTTPDQVATDVGDAAIRDAKVKADRPVPDSGPRVDALPADVAVVDAAPEPDSEQPDAARPDMEMLAPDVGSACPEFDAPLAPWRRPFDTPDTADGRDPHHSAVEPVINPGDDFTLRGKFAYGTFSLDLERENVVAFLRQDACGEWMEVGREVTDSDGRAEFEVELDLPVGRHDFVLYVPGDGSTAHGSVWVVERGTQAAVFDVDGTLTIGDEEIFREVLLGSEPEMYSSADQVVQRYIEAGYFIVFVTGRPYFLNPSTRAWLDDRGILAGPVRTTDSVTQTLPTEAGVETFKRNYLSGLIEGPGIAFAAGYGNADTDVCAYAQAGIDPALTWIIGENGGLACEGFAATNAVADYPSHLPRLEQLPPAP